MKRWLYFLIPVAAVLLLRVEHTGTDISRLEPVALVSVSIQDGLVQIETDTGAQGRGADLNAAVAALHASASGTVFLETAQDLLLQESAVSLLPQLQDLLRPACRVCLLRGKPELTDAVKFLQAHLPETSLLQCRAEPTVLPILRYEEGGFQLVYPEDQS